MMGAMGGGGVDWRRGPAVVELWRGEHIASVSRPFFI